MGSESIHVWVVEEERLRRSDVAEFRTILHESERNRAERYRRPADRLRSIVARGLARQALSWFQPSTAPQGWSIATEPDGRPVAEGGPCFSVTHTSGLVAVAVGDVSVGIDAEDRTRSTDVEAIARRWLHPDESVAVDVEGEEERRRRFFQIWTMKEAYSKALGLGLKLDLKSFCVGLADEVTVTTDEGRLVDWSFRLEQPTPTHYLALAVRARPVDVTWFRWPDVSPQRQ